MIPSFDEDGYLPEGRYLTSLSEIEEVFLFNDARTALWNDFNSVYELLLSIVGVVPWLWLGGSFFTNKEAPGDVDSVFFVSRDLLQQEFSKKEYQTLSIIAKRQAKMFLGLSVDTFVVPICPPVDAADPSKDTPEYAFLQNRGYWDNLWSARKTASGLVCASRGYLEVTNDA